jgi:hypothetical protein
MKTSEFGKRSSFSKCLNDACQQNNLPKLHLKRKEELSVQGINQNLPK